MPKKAAIAGQIANRNEMAGILGISVTTLDRWVQAGCPVMDRAANRREYRFNSADVVAWHDQRKDEERQRAAGGDDSKRRHMAAAAELKELQLAERRGSLIRVEDVAPIVEDELANVRSRLMAMGGRLAPALVGKDAAAIEAAIRDEVSAALGELSYA